MHTLPNLIQQLGRVVAYYPRLAALIGVGECVFLCQLLYWSDKTDSGEVYKSSEELEEELGMTYAEQHKVRKSLATQGILIERHARLEHRVYFKINSERLSQVWNEGLVVRTKRPTIPPPYTGKKNKESEPNPPNWDCQSGGEGNASAVESGNANSVIIDHKTTHEITAPEKLALQPPQGAEIPVTGKTKKPKKSPPDNGHLSPSPKEFQDYWNTLPEWFPRCEMMGDGRKASLNARKQCSAWREKWKLAIDRLRDSKWMRDVCEGRVPGVWRPRVDWFLQGDSVGFIMEGKYHMDVASTPQKPAAPKAVSEDEKARKAAEKAAREAEYARKAAENLRRMGIFNEELVSA